MSLLSDISHWHLPSPTPAEVIMVSLSHFGNLLCDDIQFYQVCVSCIPKYTVSSWRAPYNLSLNLSFNLSLSISGFMFIEHLQYRQHIKCLCHLILFSGQPWKAGIFTIFLKMRLREAQWFAQGHAAKQWQSWESNPGSLTHNLHAVLPP